MSSWNPMELTLSRTWTARSVDPTPRTLAVAAMFGLGLSDAQHITVLDHVNIPLCPGQIIYITGPSGGGKSTLLSCLRHELTRRHMEIYELGAKSSPSSPPLETGNRKLETQLSLIDELAHIPLPHALACLAKAGLSDAFVLLRRPSELSDGQRFRLGLARFLASDAPLLLADEFCATLDRLTAKVVAYQLRKFITASLTTPTPRAAIVATTHDDLLSDLAPDVLVYKDLGPKCTVRVSSGQFPVSS